ncbi:hypothetical protein V1502_05535 [Bacillus sp. SCS-153A]|uniref:hypothetical protein n=1 Tax=Rossellomorea sedimentorum TaxID=3115294 RepID=UPI003905E7CE
MTVAELEKVDMEVSDQDKINRTMTQVSDTRSRISSLSSRLALTARGLTREIRDTEEEKKKPGDCLKK